MNCKLTYNGQSGYLCLRKILDSPLKRTDDCPFYHPAIGCRAVQQSDFLYERHKYKNTTATAVLVKTGIKGPK